VEAELDLAAESLAGIDCVGRIAKCTEDFLEHRLERVDDGGGKQAGPMTGDSDIDR
jgi:hypothetical protein